jgi:hypothetical protein
MRSDRYQVGDRVAFVAEDEYTGSGIAERHKKKHGPGPYVVEEVEDLDASYLRSGALKTPHTQIVWIDGERYSGAWFLPLRA